MNIDEMILQLLLDETTTQYRTHILDEPALDEINIFDDLGYDSIKFIELIIELENVFEVEIPDNVLAMDYFSTFGQIRGVINELTKSKDE